MMGVYDGDDLWYHTLYLEKQIVDCKLLETTHFFRIYCISSYHYSDDHYRENLGIFRHKQYTLLVIENLVRVLALADAWTSHYMRSST